jgi:hypothetical protein
VRHTLALLTLLLVPATAVAQGPIPFELDEPGEASQILEMFLAIHDVREPSGNVTSIASDDVLRLVVNRNDGDADAGSLLVCPTGSCNPLPAGAWTVPAGESEGSYWIVGDGAPYTDGLYYANNDGAATPLEYVKSEAEASYDLVAGTLDVRAEVDTPDYGEYRDSVGEHGIEAEANVLIHDWVYVDGPGPTATLNVSATIDPFVDSPVQGTTDEFWTTQAYGDVRDVDPDAPSGLDPDLLEPTLTQLARLEVRLDIDRWSFQERWVSQSVATASALRENSLYLDWVYPPTDAPYPDLIPEDTDTLTGTLATQATIQTGRWFEVSAQVIASVDCEGAFACNLDSWTGDPVQISITSPDGTLVSWHGIAGLTRVPEPGGASLALVAVGALAASVRLRRVAPPPRAKGGDLLRACRAKETR